MEYENVQNDGSIYSQEKVIFVETPAISYKADFETLHQDLVDISNSLQYQTNVISDSISRTNRKIEKLNSDLPQSETPIDYSDYLSGILKTTNASSYFLSLMFGVMIFIVFIKSFKR